MSLFRKSRSVSTRRQRPRPGGTTQSQSAFSYRAQRSEQELNIGRQTSREQAKKASASFARFWLERTGLAILLAAVVASGVNVLSLSADAKVVPLTAGSSSFLHSQSDYQGAANKLLAGSIWNRNKITIDTGQVSRQLRQQFPELSSVSVTLPLLAHRPFVYLQATQPAVVLTAADGSFVLDTTGKALMATTSLPAASQGSLPVVTDASGLQVALNRQILTPENVSFIQTVAAQLAAKHISISGMTLPAAASELDVHLAGQPYFVKFNLQATDARQQVGTFLAVQAQLQGQHVTPAQYIDVRVDGRAYYQ